MSIILLRTLILYVLLVIVMRISGKRQIGQLQLSELVTTLLISEIAANPIVSPHTPLFHAILPILFVALLELVISFLVTRSGLIKKIFEGSPSILIRHGSIDQNELSRQRISLDELLSTLRQEGYPDPAEISFAILEQNGQVSVFDKSEEGALAYPVIIDGKINPANLKAAGKNENWIDKQLQAQNCALNDVFLLTVTDSGSLYFVKKK